VVEERNKRRIKVYWVLTEVQTTPSHLNVKEIREEVYEGLKFATFKVLSGNILTTIRKLVAKLNYKIWKR
jgi:hypothetical protein